MTPPSLPVPILSPVDRQYAVLTREAARSLVRPVGLALAALYGVFSTAHLVLWGGPAGIGMAAVASASAVVYLSAGVAYASQAIRKRPHFVLGVFCFVALLNSLLHLALRGDPVQTTNVILVFLGVGALVFHTPTLTAVLAVGILGWLGIGAFWRFADPHWVHYGFGMISATVVTTLISLGRTHFVRRAASLESEAREREGRLRDSQKRYEELFATSPGMICIHDLAGYILDANTTGANAIGIPRHRLVGMNVGPFLLNNDRQVPREYLETLVREGSATGLMTVQGADGSIRRWKYQSTLFSDAERGEYAVAAALDVTELEEAREAVLRAKEELERRVAERTLALREANQRLEMELEERSRVEEELRQKHKLEALGRLAGGIAQEFNNILTVMSGNLEVALDAAEAGAPSPDALREMEWAKEQATDLVSQILAFSRMDQATHSLFDLRSHLERTVTSLRRSLPPGIELTFHGEGDLGRLRGSAAQFHQVLGNLVSNSKNALPAEGGKIQIRASTGPATAEEGSQVDVEEGSPCVRIEVADDGQGIPPEDQDQVFDPFFTTRRLGEGLGLSVAHGIIRSFGGDITLESEPGRGTTVTVLFPWHPTERTEEREEGEAETSSTEPVRILVVDDEKAIIRLLGQSLSMRGYRVTHFQDPSEALAHFRENPESVDLLLTDLTMPRMRGDELGTKIREIRPGLPVLIMTGFGGFLDLATFSREGPTSLLPKPFSSEALLSAVEGVMRDAAEGKVSSR